ncbi:succinate receptor 1-like [Coregonus clupeaformis]|uniref:succinate receptor 1-like n=1 Tax=Coregonus clupeaformis TaxID=59861 RepID=UPI001E1C9529|nr:succinate receptor 1-like [Coregonus clupeaformis]
MPVFNCTVQNDLLLKYYLTPAYALEFALGFPSNLLVVLGYVFCLPEWKSTNVYLFNLAVSDLIFLCTLPRLSYLYAYSQSEDCNFGCIINRYILHTNLYSSILFMVWVSMDRFLLIRHPSRHHFLLTQRAALCLSIVTWVAVNIQVAPLIFFMVQDMQKENLTLCQDFGSLGDVENMLGYSLGLTVTGYLLPLLGLGLFSYHISWLLRAHEEVIQGSGTSFRRPVRVVTAVAAMFLVLYLPYHVMRNVRIASRHPWAGMHRCSMVYIESVYILSRPVAFLHSAINPVFYFFMGDKFRELLLAKIRGLVRRIEQMRGSAM